MSRWSCSTLVLVAAFGAGSCGRATTSRAVSMVKLSEMTLWERATRVVMPVFPELSISRQSNGVAVSTVWINLSGGVERVDVLEAPDADIASAVRSALLQWTFLRTSLQGSIAPLRAQGKITFYFENHSGSAEVLRPHEKQQRAIKQAGTQ